MASICPLTFRGACRTALSLLIATFAALMPLVCDAHKPSDSYIALSVAGDKIAVRWDIALRYLDAQLDLDANHDSKLSWGEVRSRQADIDKLALDSITLTGDTGPCGPGAVEHALDTHSDGT